jgi:hypothetical protein
MYESAVSSPKCLPMPKSKMTADPLPGKLGARLRCPEHIPGVGRDTATCRADERRNDSSVDQPSRTGRWNCYS